MTLIISWIGVDDKLEGKSIASLYIASDSRYSWPNSKKFDYGIKVFGSSIFPEIFGFCGDVLFSSIMFGQLIPQIDSGLLIDKEDTPSDKNKKILDYIKTSWEKYPKDNSTGSFTILYGTRNGKEFNLYKTSFNKFKGLENKEIPLPKISTKVCSEGSGKSEFDTNFLPYENKNHNDFEKSRGVYHCLDFTLKNIKDPATGGLPQIIGLFREGNSKIFGIVKDEIKYIYGKESSESINSSKIEWRNENFERIDPNTLKLIEGAQKQPPS